MSPSSSWCEPESAALRAPEPGFSKLVQWSASPARTPERDPGAPVAGIRCRRTDPDPLISRGPALSAL